LSLDDAFVSIHGPPWFHFEPPQLLNFVFDANPGPGPAFDFGLDPAFNLMRIRIRIFPKLSEPMR
jgi:hypothetical protein